MNRRNNSFYKETPKKNRYLKRIFYHKEHKVNTEKTKFKILITKTKIERFERSEKSLNLGKTLQSLRKISATFAVSVFQLFRHLPFLSVRSSYPIVSL